MHVDPDLGCDDRPLTYSHHNDEPDADGSERRRSLYLGSGASGAMQSANKDAPEANGDGTVKVRPVDKDLRCKRFVDTSESCAGVPSLKSFCLILAAQVGYHLSSTDLITSYLQANDFADGEYVVLNFWGCVEQSRRSGSMSDHVATSMAAFQLVLHGGKPTENGCYELALLNVKMQL